jgi:hypothetical protein
MDNDTPKTTFLSTEEVWNAIKEGKLKPTIGWLDHVVSGTGVKIGDMLVEGFPLFQWACLHSLPELVLQALNHKRANVEKRLLYSPVQLTKFWLTHREWAAFDFKTKQGQSILKTKSSATVKEGLRAYIDVAREVVDDDIPRDHSDKDDKDTAIARKRVAKWQRGKPRREISDEEDYDDETYVSGDDEDDVSSYEDEFPSEDDDDDEDDDEEDEDDGDDGEDLSDFIVDDDDEAEEERVSTSRAKRPRRV